MKSLVVLLAAILILLAGPTLARDACGPQIVPAYPADPTALAAEWVPVLERLDAAIPSLSPREEQWLRDEMASASGGRYMHALNSREFALQAAKRDVSGLLSMLRRLQEVSDQSQRAKAWLLFAYGLIEYDAALYLAWLVAEKVIQLESIPTEWTLLAVIAGKNKLEPDVIRGGRTRLARHILVCTLPAVLGVSVVD